MIEGEELKTLQGFLPLEKKTYYLAEGVEKVVPHYLEIPNISVIVFEGEEFHVTHADTKLN